MAHYLLINEEGVGVAPRKTWTTTRYASARQCFEMFLKLPWVHTIEWVVERVRDSKTGEVQELDGPLYLYCHDLVDVKMKRHVNRVFTLHEKPEGYKTPSPTQYKCNACHERVGGGRPVEINGKLRFVCWRCWRKAMGAKRSEELLRGATA